MNFEEDQGVPQMDFGMDQFGGELPVEEPQEEGDPDLTELSTMLLSDDWVKNPSRRSEMIDPAGELMHGALSEAKDKKLSKKLYQDGKWIDGEVSAVGPSGRLTKNGRDYIDRSRRVLEAASKDENGGLVYNDFNGKLEVAPWVKEAMLKPDEKAEEVFPGLDKYLREATALDDDMRRAPVTYEGYLEFSGRKPSEVDKGEKRVFLQQLAQQTFDPSTMDENEIGRVVEGMPVINPVNRPEIDKVEAWIGNLEGFTGLQKRQMLDEYHDTIDRDIVDYARTFSAADAGPLESIVNRPLMDELEAHLQAGGSGVDFLRANKERMSKDSYGIGSEVAATFRDAMMSIGTGATWLAGSALDVIPGVDGIGEMASRPAQLWGELAEESGAAYRNPVAFSVGGIDINRRDLTELTGQIGSFVALGGLGSLMTKSTGLAAARTAIAKGSEVSGIVGRIATAEAGLAKAGTAVQANLAKVLGEKTSKFLTAAGADTTAYLGGLQASGMSFGKTYNQVIEATGDETKAYRDASVQGISDGLSALIATGVMNRVAPGMERLLGAPEGKLSGSLIQRMREVGASKAAMLETQKALKDLAMPEIGEQLTKQLGKDLLKSTRDAAKKAGLRGIGATGDILSEGLEESFDEALSDAISIIIDDSKTWTNDAWPQIQKNWRGYVKAAVLGALGGGLGSSAGAAKSGISALTADASRKKVIKDHVDGQWNLIKANVQQFKDPEMLLTVTGKDVVKLGEVLADTEMDIKQKSKMLVDFARSGQSGFAKGFKAPTPSPAGTAPTATPATTAPVREPLEEQPPATKDTILSSMGYAPRAGKIWKRDLNISEGKPSKGNVKGTTVTPISVGGKPMSGAKVTTQMEDGSEEVRYVTPEEASKLVKDKKTRELYLSTMNQTALPGTADNVDQWSEAAPKKAVASAPNLKTPVALAEMGYVPKGDGTWTPGLTMEDGFQVKSTDGTYFNSVDINGVPYSGARIETKLPDGSKKITYISAAEAAKIAADPAAKKAFEDSAQKTEARLEEWSNKKTDEPADKGADDVGTNGEVPSSKQEGAGVGKGGTGGVGNEADRDGGTESGGSNPPVSEAEAGSGSVDFGDESSVGGWLKANSFGLEKLDLPTNIKRWHARGGNKEVSKRLREVAIKLSKDSMGGVMLSAAIEELAVIADSSKDVTPSSTAPSAATPAVPEAQPVQRIVTLKNGDTFTIEEGKSATGRNVIFIADSTSAIRSQVNSIKDALDGIRSKAKVRRTEIASDTAVLETPKGDVKPREKGSIRRVSENAKAKALEARLLGNEEVKAAIAAGLIVVVVANSEQLVKVTGASSVRAGGFKGAAYFNPETGEEFIVLHESLADVNDGVLSETISHEVLHLAESRFQETDSGKRLWNSAVKVFDKATVEFDDDFNAFMASEYPGFENLSPQSKLAEASRAFLQGKLKKFHFSEFNPFLKYLDDFLNFVYSKYAPFSELSQYFQGIEKAYLEMAPSIESPSVEAGFEIEDWEIDPQTGTVGAVVTSPKTGKKVLVSAEIDQSGKTKWVISQEADVGGFTGSLNLGREKARETAVKAIGESRVSEVEKAQALGNSGSMTDSEKAIKMVEDAFGKPAEETAPETGTPVPIPTAPDEVARQTGIVRAKAFLRREGIKASVVEQERPAEAELSQFKSRYKGDKDVWINAQTKEIGLSPAFIDAVMADDSIENKARHIADAVLAAAGPIRKSLQALPSSQIETEGEEVFRNLPKYIVPSSQLSGGMTDSAGGKWMSDKGTYTYSPGPGMVMSSDVGDIVSIGGDPDNVLVFLRAEEGMLHFVKVNMTEFGADPNTPANELTPIAGLNMEWQKTRLLGLAKDVKPRLESIMKGDVSPESIKQLRALLKKAMNEVAPGKTFVENPDNEGHFIQSSWREVYSSFDKNEPISGGAPFKMEGGLKTNAPSQEKRKTTWESSMEVNLPAMIRELRALIGDANLSNPKAELLVSLEVSRLLSKWIEEEQIHLLTMDEERFSQEDLYDFVDEIAENTEHPLYQLFARTVNERFPGSKPSLDPGVKGHLKNENVYVVASELLRKFQQIRAGGTFTEQVGSDARRLVKALDEDAKGQGFFKTAAEMVRRYMARIRQILWSMAVRGKLSRHQLKILDRLNADYIQANIRGDVDYSKEKATIFEERRFRAYHSATDEEIAEVGKMNSNALTSLREVVEDFGLLQISDIMAADENMEMSIRPDIREYMEESGRYDMAGIDKALNELNSSETYRKASTEAYMARQVMKLREAELEFDPREFFNMVEGGNFDPQGVFAYILKGMPNTPEEKSFLSDHLQRSHERLRDEREQLEREMITDELRSIQELDFNKKNEKVRPRAILLEKAAKYGLTLTPKMFENGTYRSHQDLKDHVARASISYAEGSPDADKVLSDHPRFNELKDLRLRENKSLGWLNLSKRSLESDKPLFDPETLVKDGITMQEPEPIPVGAVQNLDKQRKAAEAGVDMELAKERYRKFREYLDSVDDYNNRLRRMTERALGVPIDLNTRDYGLAIRDSRLKKSDEKLRLGKRSDKVVAATTPDEVFFFNYRAASYGRWSVVGDGTPRNWGKRDGLEDKELMLLHKTAVESNAAFLGRHARMMFYINDVTGKIPGSFNRELYNYSAGFAFRGETNEYDRMIYETPLEAFPKFNGFDELFGVDRSLKKDKEYSSIGVSNLINYITKTEAWLDAVEERIDPANIINKVAGEQTPAARAVLLLDPRLKELREYIGKIKGLVIQDISPYLEYSPNPDAPFSSQFARDSKGVLKLKDGNAESIFKALKEYVKTGSGTIFEEMMESQIAANTEVGLVRRMVKEFINPRWKQNVEREAIQTIRNAAYKPDHPEMLALRDGLLDPAIAHNLGFAMGYFAENESNYWVGPAYAFQMLKQYEGISGRGAKMKFTKNPVKRGVDVNGIPFSEARPSLGDAFVLTTGESSSDDPRVGRSDSGVTGSTLDSFLSDKFSEKLTGAELAALEEDAPAQALRKWLTSSLMFIGYRSRKMGGDVNDARTFARDVMNKQVSNEGMVRDLVETGLAGMFAGNARDSESFQNLVSDFYDTYPTWMRQTNGPLLGLSDSVTGENFREIARAIASGEPGAAMEIEHEFDAESFVVNLLEFKKSFEDKAIKDARFESKETIAVLSNALAASDHPTEEKEAITRLIEKGLVNGDVVAYDSRLTSAYDLYLGENPGVSILISNLIGETIIVQPTNQQTSKSAAEIGLRVILGKEGQPNIVWAPESGTNRTDQQAAIQQVLTQYAEDPVMRERISDLATVLRDTLLPAFDVEAATASIERLQQQLDPKNRPRFAALAADHFAKLTRYTDELGVSEFQPGSSIDFGQQGTGVTEYQRNVRRPGWRTDFPDVASPLGLASDISLITNVLTDSKYKEAFDRGYLGSDDAQEFGLPDEATEALHVLVKRLRVIDGEYVSWAEANAVDGSLNDAGEEYADAFNDAEEDYETTAERDDLDVDELAELAGAKDDGLSATQETKANPKEGNLAPNPNLLIEMLSPDRLKVKRGEEVLPPSDMVLLNGLASLLQGVKIKNDQLSDDFRPVPNMRARMSGVEKLFESPVDILRRKKVGDRAAPIFPEINRPNNRTKTRSLFVGEALNLGRPNVEGHTMLKMKMDAVRGMTQQSSWLSRIPMVNNMIEQGVGSQMKKLRAGESPVVGVEIRLNETFMERALEFIPQLNDVRREVERALLGMNETEAFLESQIDEANKVLAKKRKWSFPETLDDEVTKSTNLRRQMAEFVVDLAQSISKTWNKRASYEKFLLEHSIRQAIGSESASVLPEIAQRVSKIRQLIEQRDLVVRPDLDPGAEIHFLNKEIEKNVKWINNSLDVVNKAANKVAKDRFKKLGLKVPQKPVVFIRPLRKKVEKLDSGDLRNFSGNIDFDDSNYFREAVGSFTSQVLTAFGSKRPNLGAQEDSAFNSIMTFLEEAEGMDDVQVLQTIDLSFAEIEGNKSHPFIRALNEIALKTDEARELGIRPATEKDAGSSRMVGDQMLAAETGEERSARERAEWDKQNAMRQLDSLRQQRSKLFDNGGIHYVGRYRHDTGEKNSKGEPITANVELTLSDPLKATIPLERSSERETRNSKWNQNEEARKNFYILREAMMRSLNQIAEGRVDAMYKKLRGQTEIFGGFNPVKMVMEAQRRVAIEDAVFKAQLQEAGITAQQDELGGLTAEALAYMTNSTDSIFEVRKEDLNRRIEDAIKNKPTIMGEDGKPRLMNEEEKNQVRERLTKLYRNKLDAKLKQKRLPENFDARRDLIGKMFDDPANGGKIVLVPENAKARLMRAFPGKITKNNVNGELKNIILKAMSQSSGYPSFMDDNVNLDGKFYSLDEFELTKGKDDINVEDAGKLFSERFKSGLTRFLSTKRKNGFDVSGANTKKTIQLYATLVEKLVHAYDAPQLIDPNGDPTQARTAIQKILKSIDNQGTLVGKEGFDSDDSTMMDFDLIGAFSKAFAELESEQIMKSLVSGLSIQDGSVYQHLLKYAHHQDARNRSKFIKNHIARNTAIHLQAFLDRGFDGDSGRGGHQTAHKAAQDAIAEEAKKVGRSSKDHTIGYMLAQLKGLADSTDMTLTESLTEWYKAMSQGWSDLQALDTAQKNRWKSQSGRFFNANHVELIRDIPMIKEIFKGLADSKAMEGIGTIDYDTTEVDVQARKDAVSASIITKLENALRAQVAEPDKVSKFAEVIHRELTDAYNATAVTRAVLSKRFTEEEKSGNRHDDDRISPSGRAYSSVPIRLAYAANPDSNEPNIPREGRWIPDPADVVDIKESAFYGGFGRHEPNQRNSAVFRPLSMNGLAAPMNILEDSLYRTNVTPNYLILRQLLGKVQSPSGIPVVDKALLISPKMQLVGDYDKAVKTFRVAVAAVANEIETNIFNDSQIGVVNTGFSQAATFASSMFVVRSLASLQQLWNQTISPATFFVIKKMVIGEHREALDFLKVLSKLIGSMAADFATSPRNFFGSHGDKQQFHHKVARFTKNVSPYIHFRGVEGQDQARDALRHQVRSGQSKLRLMSGIAAKEYQNIGEAALNFTIGSGERIISRAIFLTELASQMRRADTPGQYTTAEELIENFDAKKIPIIANEMARIKVSDMMGQSDVSKKSFMFQSHSDSPVWSSLLKSLVRFSNHTASTSSNLTAFLPGLIEGDQRTKDEALENIVGTLGQNIMFQFAKIHTLVPLAFYVFYLAGGDDEEEAAAKAQEKAGELLTGEDSGPLGSMLKELTFGSEKQLFQEWKEDDVAVASAKAEMLSKVGMELTQSIPVVGVMFGYSPISGMARPIINDVASEIMSRTSGLMGGRELKVAEAWYERDAIGVREFRSGPIETTAGLTAPTSVAYDMLQAGDLMIDAQKAGARPIDILAYLASESVPFLRDYRTARAKVLREEIKDYEK